MFNKAWHMAVARCGSEEDREVFEATREAWRRAYEGEPPLPLEESAGRLGELWAAMEKGEPLTIAEELAWLELPVYERECETCGADMAGRRARARFCSDRCRRAAYRDTEKGGGVKPTNATRPPHGFRNGGPETPCGAVGCSTGPFIPRTWSPKP